MRNESPRKYQRFGRSRTVLILFGWLCEDAYSHILDAKKSRELLRPDDPNDSDRATHLGFSNFGKSINVVKWTVRTGSKQA